MQRNTLKCLKIKSAEPQTFIKLIRDVQKHWVKLSTKNERSSYLQPNNGNGDIYKLIRIAFYWKDRSSNCSKLNLIKVRQDLFQFIKRTRSTWDIRDNRLIVNSISLFLSFKFGLCLSEVAILLKNMNWK